VKVLTIVDEHTRECVAIDVERRFRSDDVLFRLAELFVGRGVLAINVQQESHTGSREQCGVDMSRKKRPGVAAATGHMTDALGRKSPRFPAIKVHEVSS